MGGLRRIVGSAYAEIARLASSGDSSLHTVLKVFLLFAAYPFYMLNIYLDRRLYIRQKAVKGKPLARNPLIAFPRRPQEIIEDLEGFFNLLTQNAPQLLLQAAGVATVPNSNPPKLRFVSGTTFAPLESEPSKNEAVLRVIYKFEVGTNPTDMSTVDIFIKTPSAREFSTSLKALSATYNTAPKECIFYSYFMDAVTEGSTKPFALPVPPPIYTEWSRMFDSYIVVNKMVLSKNAKPYYSIPDWKMNDISKMRHMMRVIANFHASSFELKTTPQFNFKKYVSGEVRSAVGWVNGGMSLFFEKRATPTMKLVWKGLTERLQREPLVMSHGDYRPGNMLWKPEDEVSPAGVGMGADQDQYPDMIATDLELCAVTPYMWDATYALFVGLPVDVRREHEGTLLKEYLTELHKALGPSSVGSKRIVAADSEDSTILHELLGVALYYYGWTLTVLGEMPQEEADKSIQGNTAEDGTAWKHRMIAMMKDAVGDTATPARRARMATEMGLTGPEGLETLNTFWREVNDILNGVKPKK